MEVEQQAITEIREDKKTDEGIIEKIDSFIENIKSTTEKVKGKDWSMYQIADTAFDAMQSAIARQKLAAYPPDHIIEIARNACGTLEFDRADEMIRLGYEKAEAVLGK